MFSRRKWNSAKRGDFPTATGLASRLHECLDAVTIKAFPGGKGFGGKAAVNGRSIRIFRERFLS
jgi:hypothetical protein